MRKKLQKIMAIVLIGALLAALCACGKSDDSSSLKDALDGQRDALSSGESAADSSQDINPSDKAEMSSDNAADLSKNSDSAEADYLLDVTFFADKREAEAAADAAGGKLLSSYDSDLEEDGNYNPMSWCYALITAIHDDTEVTISRGYEGITRGDETSGFITTDVEHYELMNAGEKLVIEVNVEWYPVFQIDVTNGEYKAAVPLGWDIYTSKDEKGIPAPLTVTGQKVSQDDALIFNEDDFAPYIGKWQMTKESYGEEEASPVGRTVTAVIKDNLTLTLSDEEDDEATVYELSNLLEDDAHTSIWYSDMSGNIITGQLSGNTMILDIPVQLESLDDPRPASRKGYFEK